MALPEFAPPISENAPLTASVPRAALRRLPLLHDESRLALRRANLMAQAVPAAGSLLGLGTLVAMFGGGALTPSFGWCVLVCLGVAAVLVSHLRAASVFKDLAGSMADMRAILLYVGLAWGSGAFLALAPHAPQIIVFTALPCLVLGLLLGDLPAVLAFAAPVLLCGVSALLLRCGSVGGTAMLLMLTVLIAMALWQRRSRPGSQGGLFTNSGLR
jgi:hypothetical protein